VLKACCETFYLRVLFLFIATLIQQKAVKQLQTIMAGLPPASRPKTAQEIKDFVQKYSSVLGMFAINNSTSQSSSTQSKSTVPGSTAKTSETVKSNTPVIVPLNFGPTNSLPPTTSDSLSTNAMAQVDQHFHNSLTVAKMKTAFASKPASTVVDLTKDEVQSKPTVAVPKASSSTIQAGVATPLPPGLTLETLAVLCRLPEEELGKLKLPTGLLSAIKVWKEKQPTGKKNATPQTKVGSPLYVITYMLYNVFSYPEL